MFYKNLQNNDTTFIQISSSFNNYTSRPSLTPIKIVVS